MNKAVKIVVKILIGLAVVAGVTYAFWPRPLPVDVAEAAVQPMLVTVDEDGTTRIRERYIVSSPLPGRLRRITLDPGDPVSSDDTVLAQLEPTDPVLLDAGTCWGSRASSSRGGFGPTGGSRLRAGARCVRLCRA